MLGKKCACKAERGLVDLETLSHKGYLTRFLRVEFLTFGVNSAPNVRSPNFSQK